MNTLTITEFSEIVGLPEEELKGLSRKDEYKIPRQIYWCYLSSKGKSYREIACDFGRRHPTILSGVRTVRNLLENQDSILTPYFPFINKFLHDEQRN